MRLVILQLLLLVSLAGVSQTDTAGQDTGKMPHSPRRATILSACLPGAGQIYNGKWWKTPIIYAGFAGLGYSVYFNNGEYKEFKKAYIHATDNDPNTIPEYLGTPDYFQSRRNYYKRYRDLSVIGMAALYALQILDANVDAHLMYFDVSDDLGFKLLPPSSGNNGAFKGQVFDLLSLQVRF